MISHDEGKSWSKPSEIATTMDTSDHPLLINDGHTTYLSWMTKADGYRLLHSASGYTFPTWDPHVRLDYFFVPKDSADCVRTCEVVCEGANLREASDHFPLTAEIELP